jgi:hypothetical protein
MADPVRARPRTIELAAPAGSRPSRRSA